jgi:hypothetical protein
MHYAMKTYGGAAVHILVLFTWALDEGEWSASRPGRFILWEKLPALIAKEAGWAPEPLWTAWKGENS